MKSAGKIHWGSNCFTKKYFGLGKFNTLKDKDCEKENGQQNKLCSLVMHWPCKTFTFPVLQGKYSELSVTVVLRKQYMQKSNKMTENIAKYLQDGIRTKKTRTKPPKPKSPIQKPPEQIFPRYSYAAINSCCNHPPPRTPGICTQNLPPLWGFCILIFAWGRGFVGIGPKGRGLVYKRFLPLLEFSF